MSIIKKINLFGIILFCGFFLFSLAARADHINLTAQRCQLGDNCPIPGNDEGITYFNVTPATGGNYHCTITSDQKILSVFIYGGKDFVFLPQTFKVNGEVTTKITGRFIDSQNPDEVGQIKIKRLNKETGKVLCMAD